MKIHEKSDISRKMDFRHILFRNGLHSLHSDGKNEVFFLKKVSEMFLSVDQT